MNHKHIPLFSFRTAQRVAANDFTAPLFWCLHCLAIVHPFLYGYDLW